VGTGHGGYQREKNRQDSSFSEEKEAKRLLSIWARGPIPTMGIGPRTQIDKSFLFLFFKKESLPS
jgi:hypothetical protein